MLSTLKKIPQLYRYPRHFRSLIEHSTTKKLKNLVTIERERKRRKTTVAGFPYVVYVDPCNACNLSCPLCPGGVKELARKRQMLKADTYRMILEQIKDYVYEVNLYNWGEAFLNPDVFEMIQFNQENNIGTNISSNLSLDQPGLAQNIVDSGLEYLSISMDGASPGVYRKYRVNGDFDRVIGNIEKIASARKSSGRKKPFLEWQYIVTRHNEHQIGEAKDLARRLGVDLIRFIPVRLIVDYDEEEKRKMAEEWFPRDPAFRKYCFEDFDGRAEYLHKENCFHLYRSVAVNPDGGVHPCNIIYRPEDDFGNVLSADFATIWNNEQFRSARALFAKGTEPTRETRCEECRIFRK